MTDSLMSGGGGASGGRDGSGGGGMSGGRSGDSAYPIGFSPAFRVYVKDRLALTQAIGVQEPAPQVAIRRVEAYLGIDSIHTLTLSFVGEDCALFVRDNFEKRTPVRIEVGYLDEPASWQELFRGYALQAYPSGANPVTVDVECDSAMYRAREERGAGDNTDANQAEYIKSRLAQEHIGISVNIGEVKDTQADEGGSDGSDTGSLLEFINRWTEAHYVHWVDMMDDSLHLFYPGAKPDFLRPWREWALSVRRLDPADSDPAILVDWSPQLSIVESPRTIEGVWYDDREFTLENPAILKATNDNGIEDTTLQIGFISAPTMEAAQEIVNAAAADYYWASIMGAFAISAGLPILPFDEIRALNGPAGLEMYYDRPLEVYEVTHTIDEAGWRVSGRVRGAR